MTNKAICPMPFWGLDIEPHGEMKPCCIFMQRKEDQLMNPLNTSVEEYWNSDFIQDIRQKMLRGEKVPQCNICYDEEKNTGYSKRIRELDLVHDQNIYHDPKLQKLDFKLGNTCNLKCRTCNSYASSLVNSENIELNKTQSPEDIEKFKFIPAEDTTLMKWPASADIFSQVLENNIQDIINIDFMGGEPLLDRTHIEFVKSIPVEHKNRMYVNYVTNGTRKINFELFKDFKNMHVTLSADGIGDRFEFIRHPAKWDQVSKNIKEIHQKSDTMLISYTLSVYSLYGIPDALDWYAEQGIKVWINYCHYPWEANSKIMPDHKKQEIIDILRSRNKPAWQDICSVNIEDVIGFISDDLENNEYTIQDTIKSMKIRDRFRKENYLESLPEFKDL
jgi:MoaA/NifB/PqqE/SkfB family radical SAM enzyme